MSGHNKWTQINHRKAAMDAKKSQIFSKLARLISLEAKKTKGDRGALSLRAVIEKAKKVNMPIENIDRAIKKATELSSDLEPTTYEAYGPGGVALIIETLTNNRNRTAPEIKHLLSENGGNLTAPGGVTWAFEKTNEGWQPKNMIDWAEEDLEKLSKLVDILEDNQDVQEVFTNAC